MAELSYRQQLALFCLANEGEPCTGAELMLAMGETAQAAGHDKPHWVGFTPAKIVADLKELEKRKLVVRSEPKRNTRRSRDEPQWQVVKKAEEFALPTPPDPKAQPIAEPPRHPYDDVPREQLITLLEAHEGFTELLGRFMADMATLQRATVAKLRAAGFEVEKS